ncbi:MAG TPA: [FeFe] hydrogenase, group A [Tenuifilaceae bacterium]|nr:[FeFe] hydrogenase, group A [Tenuifilaceae bacterium]HPE17712.1 [FeFe] hydrogenase, group A [Tenuifilaceae bacterium]HPJ45181.1 [FeFe] hydrogenase, group A [Tenuifilaceae bacterium]HPQ33410.1 [FeFe] hydrogenase, group A [Tenuifilaceae bacterium]HRX66950.1 [FeFe] hydrogenase, group A [Tenuifilaceae bacterium]
MNFDIEVNGKNIEARKGETILSTLTRNGIKVPTLCNLKELSPTGACRICVVEVEGFQSLVASCSQPVEKGMKILTHSPRVIKARRTLVELLLSNHPDDCLYCERNGNCELQELSKELNIRERKIIGRKSNLKLDMSSPSIVRDLAKCILCGRCIRTCDEIQSVSTLEFLNRGSKTKVGTTMNQYLNFSSCIECGQCVLTCPTAALRERCKVTEVQDALNNDSLTVIAQIDPAVFVSLGEELGLKAGKNISGIIFAALKKIGFDYVFDTGVAADIATIEVATELKTRIENKKHLPLITSSCPAWVKFVEQFYPELIPHLSHCKSPQQILGSLVINHIAPDLNIKASSIFSVSITPCLARKFEAQRADMTSKGVSDVDAVLSTRELAKLIRLYGIDTHNIEPKFADPPFATSSSSGKLHSISGGTTESIIRTYFHLSTGRELTSKKINEVRINSSTKNTEIKIGKETVSATIANGITNIHQLMSSIISGENGSHLVEVMACPGGCINGGGQPTGASEKEIKARLKAIYEIDDNETIKQSHNNEVVKKIYHSYIKEPRGENALKTFGIKYSKREVLT